MSVKEIYTDGEINTDTNVDKCTDCPFNPFREDDEDVEDRDA